MEKSCGCKGIRSCLHCESLNKKGDLHASSKEKQELIHVSALVYLLIDGSKTISILFCDEDTFAIRQCLAV